MRLANNFPLARRHPKSISTTSGRLGRARAARRFPEKAERLITAAEFKRLAG